MAKITILVENNCVTSGVLGTIDALSVANLWWLISKAYNGKQLFEPEIVTVDGEPVLGNGNIELKPHKSIEEVEDTDLIRVCALLPPFDLKSERAEKTCEWLRNRYAGGDLISTACTGTFILAESGFLDGKVATTNWMFAELFKRQYPKVDLREDEIITVDGRIICAGAASSYLNLSIFIIEKFGSPDLASKCAKSLLVDPNRRQAPYIVREFWKAHSDSQVLQAQAWMEENFTEKVSIDEVAKKVGLSPRQFMRRFKNATGETSVSYLQHLRVEKAKQNLETTMDTVSEITWQVGYEDINSFRRLFIKHTGLTPKMYRSKFSRISGQV